MSETSRLDHSNRPASTLEVPLAFQDPNSAVFRFSKLPGAEHPLRVILPGIPTFGVCWQSGGFQWWGSLKAVCSRAPFSKSPPTGYALRDRVMRREYFPGRSLTTSLLFHAAALLLIVYLHQEFPASASALDSPANQPQVIYYRIPIRQLPKTLPHIAPPGLGGNPLNGVQPTQAPAPGSTSSQSVLTLVSKLAHPDNSHQTIIQPASPPELKITSDIKLPNIILGKAIEAPKAPLQFDPTSAKPTEKERYTSAEPAPALAPNDSDNPVMTFLTPSNFKPSMPVPVVSGTAQRKSPSGTGSVQAPNVPATSGDSLTLAVITTDPSGLANASEILLPPGNRVGEFSASPSANPGSPGINRAGVTGGGSGNTGKGGDNSTGPGSSASGGGNTLVSDSTVAITGAGANSYASGILGAALAQGIIYPVPAALNIRRNSLIVSAGPMGGGGLNAYGALHCAKIYTIFLAMPGKNWTMQYCAQSTASDTGAEPPTVVRFGEGIVPPQADSRYDFRRSSLPPDKVGKLIILKGLLREDGLIDELQVYQGVLPEMDDNARLALSQWKFKPALREGKPIPVQVLVGIPSALSPSASTP